MSVQDSKSALAVINHLEKDNTQKLGYARRLIQNRPRALFIHDRIGHCNFSGYLLVSVVDRKTEAAVYIEDADDWGIELIVSDVKTAETIFDELFRKQPAFDKALQEKLRNYGFIPI